jgi:antitoxin component YwqK of YwqJK toxin-antitoxin module
MRQLTLLLFLLLSSSLFSQSLKLSDLILFCGKKNWDEVNNLISAKGWEYFTSQEGDFDSYNEVTWSYDRNYYNDKAKGWLTLYTYEGLPSKIQYQVFNKKGFQTIESSIGASGFKKTSSEILDDIVLAEYVNDKYTLSLSYSKIETDYYYESASTSYTIVVTKKGTVYDPDNGLKYTFRDDLSIESEYHLKDGEFDGQMIEYYPDGSKKSISHWTKGKLNGKVTHYDEEGNLSSEFFIANELLNGIRKDYESGILVREVNFKNDEEEGVEKTYHLNGKLKWTINFSNGKRNGIYQEYNMDGLMVRKETYINDLLIGPFENILFDEENKPFEIVRGNLVDDKLDGKVVILSYKEKDTLRIQNYQNGLKSGKWLEYENKKIAYEYGYKDDELDGVFKEYFTEGEYIGKVIKEGFYRNGKKHGTEKIFYKLFDTVDANGEPTGAIFLPVLEITNYIDGLKNGYYSYEDDGILYEAGEYVKDQKTGQWLETEFGFYWDSTNLLQLKGMYFQDKKEGVWKGYIDDRLYVSISYKNGVLEGPWQFYRNDGSLGTGYEYENGKRVAIHFYDDNTNYQNITLIKYEKNLTHVEVELKSDQSVRRIDYVVADQVMFNDPDFTKYFNDQTNATSEPDPELNNKKEGRYYYKNPIKEVKGFYTSNLKSGEWVTTYKKEGIKQYETYRQNNLLAETFTDANNSPYTGTLNYDKGKVQISIKIKDGVRNGPTTETLDGMEISKTKYKKGVVKE